MFVNETKNDLEFNVKVAVRMARRTPLLLAVAALIMLICGGVVLGLELAFPEAEGESDLVIGIVILVLGVFFALSAVCYKPFMRRVLKKLMQGKEGVIRTEFSEEGYVQTATLNDGTESTTRGDYAAFTECREYADLWVLYLNKATVFGIDKNGMKEGTEKELSAFLMQKFSYKYKTCFRRK